MLIANGGAPSYSPTGHLLYVQEGNLMSAPYDRTRRELTQPPVQVVEDAPHYSLSRTGMLVYSTATQVTTSLWWVDRSGHSEILLPWARRQIHLPRLSRDNRRIVMQIRTGTDRNIWTYDMTGDALTKLTFEWSNGWPVFTPDGARVFYGSNRSGGAWDIYWKAADGTGAETPLLAQPPTHIPRAVSPNGDWLAYSESAVDTDEDLWLLPLREEGMARPFARTGAREQEPAFSPDSRWLAYVSNESGRDEVYVKPIAGDGGKWQISANGGVEPLWNPNGHEIFFRESEKVYAVDVTIGAGIAAGAPTVLFEGRYALSEVGSNYDISLDGQRFLMVDSGVAGSAPLNIVTNWSEELKRLVPTH
jgi:serine/threonine-protein kinase